MTTGIIALAVPLSSNFAGEFLILAGVFQQGWAWAVIGAGAIVLAAMYMLRLISAVLHQERRAGGERRGARPAQRRARDRRAARRRCCSPSRPGPLRSAATRSECDAPHRPFRRARAVRRLDAATRRRAGSADDPRAARRLVRALAVAGDDRAPRACCCSSPCSCRSASRKPSPPPRPPAPASSRPSCSRSCSPRRARTRATAVADSIFRDRWAAVAQVLIAGCGVVAVLLSYGERWREEHVAEYYALLAAAGAGMAFFVQASNLMTLFLGLEWFSISLYVLCAIDIDLVGSLEAGLKYLIIGAVGSATLLFGSALVYGSTGQLGFDKIAAAGHTHDSLLVLGLAMVIAGLAFKTSAAPFHMWTPDAYTGAPTPVTAFMSSATKVAALVVTYRLLVTAFPSERAPVDLGDRRHRLRLARDRQHRGARAAEREAAARVLVGLACRLHADPDRRRERARRPCAPLLPDPVLRDVARRLRA